MHVIFEHQGDGENSPEQCRDWRLDDTEWLQEWEHTDSAMTHAEGVTRLYTDKMEQVRVEFPDRTGRDAPALPNVDIIQVEPEG